MIRRAWQPAALALFVLATSLWAAGRLRRLNDVRAQVAAMQTAPSAALPPGGDPVAAIRAARAGGDVTVLRLDAAGRGRADVVLVGPELAVRRMIGRIETGQPAIRFGPWRIAPEPGAADRVRFTATGIAVRERAR